jgi:hypothetical protein
MIRRSSVAVMVIAASLFAIPTLLALDSSPAGAQRSPFAEGERCPTVLYPNREELLCSCGKTEGQHDVWGTDLYTDDSAVCHAAKHFGVIGEAGGVIHVRRAPGRDSYPGSTRNGFTSQDYGAWERSIVFDSRDQVAASLGGMPLCAVLYSALEDGWTGSCMCEPGRTGPVYGTNPYRSDSAVCGAARHAGVIGENGGPVHLAPAAGQDSAGSTRNGVTTQALRPSDPSFMVSAVE